MKRKISAGKKASYTVVFEKNEEGGFTVTVPCASSCPCTTATSSVPPSTAS